MQNLPPHHHQNMYHIPQHHYHHNMQYSANNNNSNSNSSSTPSSSPPNGLVSPSHMRTSASTASTAVAAVAKLLSPRGEKIYLDYNNPNAIMQSHDNEPNLSGQYSLVHMMNTHESAAQPLSSSLSPSSNNNRFSNGEQIHHSHGSFHIFQSNSLSHHYHHELAASSTPNQHLLLHQRGNHLSRHSMLLRLRNIKICIQF